MKYTYCYLFDEHNNTKVRISSWQDGLEVEEYIRGGWESLVDEDYFIVFNRKPGKLNNSIWVDWRGLNEKRVSDEVLNLFSAAVPLNVQKLVSRFQYNQLLLMQALRVSPELKTLAHSSPLLLWLIVEKCSTLWEDSYIDRLKNINPCKKKQHLHNFGYVGTSFAVRFLSKISLDYYLEEDLLHLQEIMESEERIQALRHFRVITRTLLQVGAKCHEMLQYGFARRPLSKDEMSPEEAERMSTFFRNIHYVADELQKSNLEDVLKNITDINDLEKLHAVLSIENEQRCKEQDYIDNFKSRYGLNFPAPPVPGNGRIRPIRTITELWSESQVMHHCAKSYAERIYCGKSYLYNVLAPERGTIEIIMENGIPKLNQIALQKNGKPSPALVELAREWLASAGCGSNSYEDEKDKSEEC